ncbi:hypothetical protein [Paraliomyxa miuraensis]|uniref:hypothetical protein n=1 Tax=Paraliomyxa miuraensis TaxID=376150 RepID=UPI002253E131|nr:hypothetical protein [Paraliomyxa miuraensis]MCX4244253.1 hypothetical protein [Paraliomyxa miuraensis]
MHGTTRPAPTLANAFRFTYRDQELSFSETSFGGQPLLSLGQRQFIGDEITIETTRLGTIVTVALEVVADGDSTILSLVLPPIRLLGWAQAHVKALAIRSVVRGTIAGPPLGPGLRYDAQEIEGTAAFIVT